MNPQEARKLWVDVLRSGDYKQTKSRLCNLKGDAYCCLGVACEVYQKQGAGDLDITIVHLGNINDESVNTKSYDSQTHLLPDKVSTWLGISANGELKYGIMANGIHRTSLSNLNDLGDYSFAELADVIESGNLKETTSDERDRSPTTLD